MIQSMTGYGTSVARSGSLVKICVELRSANHKFLETVLHLPEGLLSVEDKAKKEIESKIKRGRISCVVNIFTKATPGVSVNDVLLKRYISAAKHISKKYGIKEKPKVDTLMNMSGVLVVSENKSSPTMIWPVLKKAINAALKDLLLMRSKEGKALFVCLQAQSKDLEASLKFVRGAFKKAISRKIAEIKSDPERSAFLKEADITEELDRLEYHVKNFNHKLLSDAAVGKELDFIAQEMQREANTIGAKSCDVQISARAVQMKSQIEKLREQVQNIE